VDGPRLLDGDVPEVGEAGQRPRMGGDCASPVSGLTAFPDHDRLRAGGLQARKKRRLHARPSMYIEMSLVVSSSAKYSRRSGLSRTAALPKLIVLLMPMPFAWSDW
jgi:hypothetical protein